MVKRLDFQSRSPGLKTSEWFQGWLSLNSFEVDETNTRYSWGPKGNCFLVVAPYSWHSWTPHIKKGHIEYMRKFEAHSKEKFLNRICRDILTMKFWHSEQSPISAKHPSQALFSCELTNRKQNEWERRKNLAERSRKKNLMCNSEILWQGEEAASIFLQGWGEGTYCWYGLIYWPFIFGYACTMKWDTWLNP